MTPREINDAFLASLARESGLPEMPTVTVRVATADGDVRLAAVVENNGAMIKVREFVGGRQRWIPRSDIIEVE